MLLVQQQLLAEINAHFTKGINFIQAELGTLGPREALVDCNHPDLDGYYHKVSEWGTWVAELDALLRSRLVGSDYLCNLLTKIGPATLMKFRVFFEKKWMEIDLGERDRWTGRRAADDLREMLQREQLVHPAWSVKRQALLDAVRETQRAIEAALPKLLVRGEPQTPSLESACLRLAKLDYIDIGAAKRHIVLAEDNADRGQWEPAASELRSVIEQITREAYDSLALARPGTQAAPNQFARSAALATASMMPDSIHRFAYGAFALLSHVGSHAVGSGDDEEGAGAFHVGVVALSQLSRYLTVPAPP